MKGRAMRVLALLFILLFAASASAATYYVDRTKANDTNSCLTEALACRTIPGAIAKGTGADRIEVKNGTYTEPITIRRSGITLIAFPGHSPIIDVGNLTTHPYQSVVANGIYIGQPCVPSACVSGSSIIDFTDNVTIQGFEIRRALDAIKYDSGNGHVFKENWLHHNGCSGILGNGKNIRIDGNLTNDNGDFSNNQCHGMYVTGQFYTIINNVASHNAGRGMQLSAYRKCPVGGGECLGRAPDTTITGMGNSRIANNTLLWSYRGGPIVHNSNPNCDFTSACNVAGMIYENNIFYESSQLGAALPNRAGIQLLDMPSNVGAIIRNNLCYSTRPSNSSPNACWVRTNSGVDTVLPASSGYATISSNLHANPSFVSAPAVATPSVTSACPFGSCPLPDVRLNAHIQGLNLSALFTNDITDAIRSVWSIGAHEFGGAIDEPPAAPTGLFSD